MEGEGVFENFQNFKAFFFVYPKISLKIMFFHIFLKWRGGGGSRNDLIIHIVCIIHNQIAHIE